MALRKAATMVRAACIACMWSGMALAQTATVAVGDLTLTHDASVWSVKAVEGGVDVFLLEGDHEHFAGTIRISPRGECSIGIVEASMQGAYPRNWSQKAFTMPVDGFDLHLGTLEMGCRNLAGSPVFGCTAVKGSVYTIEADPAQYLEALPYIAAAGSVSDSTAR